MKTIKELREHFESLCCDGEWHKEKDVKALSKMIDELEAAREYIEAHHERAKLMSGDFIVEGGALAKMKLLDSFKVEDEALKKYLKVVEE